MNSIFMPTRPAPPPTNDQARLNELKRRIYLSISLAGLGLSVGLWFQARLGPPAPVSAGWSLYPVIVICLLLTAGLLSRRIGVAVMERLALVLVSVVYLLQLSRDFLGAAGRGELLLQLDSYPGSAWTLLCLTVVAFSVLTRAGATRLAVLLSALGLAVPVGAMWLNLVPRDPAVALWFLRSAVVEGVTIALLASLLWYKDRWLAQQLSLEAWQRQAQTDPLTGVANRRRLYERIEQAFAASPPPAAPLSLIVLDLDHFKRVNDEHGHNAGDAVLVSVAQLLTRTVRGSDQVGRWGGEEFLIVLPETDAALAVAVAGRLHAALRDHHTPPVGRVTGSLGVATAVGGDTLESLVARADRALYTVKAEGRDGVRFGSGLGELASD